MKIAVTFLCILTFFSCQSRRQQNVNPENTISIKIQLNGIDQTAIENYALVAKLSTCAEATGKLDTDTTFIFAVHSVKKGDVCSLKLLGPKSEEAGVEFFDAQAAGVYYEASTVTIAEELNGALSATAYLEKVFTKKIQAGSTTWRIEAPVLSETTFPDSCTCRIQCSPSFTNDAAILKTSTPANGNCTFDNIVKESAENSTCDQIVIQCSSQLFAGKWPSPQTVTKSSGKINSLPAIKVLPATVNTSGNVEITPVILKPTNTPKP